MPASRAQRAATADRRSKAIAMRLAGLDYPTIADRLGYADRAAAHKDITRAMEAAVQEMSRNADVLLQLELTRLDRLQAGVWAAAAAGDIRAGHLALAIIDRRCKLLKLDPAIRHEVVTLGAIEQEIERLSQELAELDSGQADEAAGAASST
ncbi:hypothetical protein [Verrucosispora sp. TAA-831]|uniref:hypothetical protein n=1 Tax=Verrucosispora sp. TAA-831 TaxID=3422227 RepID=UPI003D6DDF79